MWCTENDRTKNPEPRTVALWVLGSWFQVPGWGKGQGMALRVDIVTAERLVYSEEGVERLIVPGVEGELGVLTLHAPLLTMMQPGVLRIVKGADEGEMGITGG